ncbi:formate dehydrogenase accessory sulfurtransferase FdhD [Actinomadura alba]|uniref:Sulfur carrier protein FdhD n=1 Tax=Actinomadura alba TaxID=406431 RepID=A0ABR7LTN8_9ACTN|nr:formate dehydrogenase accessory sulfurtransferase FdhD [Actinomadura alba]MBC6468215.1 formate dehydrogenase accessory sulfurtransferase FdhD [Actinomadura alba]
MRDRPGSTVRAKVHVVDDGQERVRRDTLATEEPLELRLLAGGDRRTLAVTMRTPGHDFELAAGFLHGEGVVASPEDIRRISYCTDVDVEQQYNIVNVTLDELPDLPGLDRHFATTSACGVCGKESLEALKIRGCPVLGSGPSVDAETVYGLPDALRKAQGLFESTGGLHAAGLFGADGSLVCVREDVGRHNAVDKLIGWALMSGRLPLSDHVLMVSGRTSYEIMQKALAAGIPVVCAVSAPSSLAVSLAEEFGMTLVGFLRNRRFNIYAGAERVKLPALAGPR